MTRQIEITAPPEPKRLRYLNLAGLSTYQISRMVNLSQSAVARKIREIAEQENAEARRRFWMSLMFAQLTLCATIATAALVTMALRR